MALKTLPCVTINFLAGFFDGFHQLLCHAPNPTYPSEREHPLTTPVDHSATSPGDPADPTTIRV